MTKKGMVVYSINLEIKDNFRNQIWNSGRKGNVSFGTHFNEF